MPQLTPRVPAVRPPSPRRGITIVELLVALTILGVVGTLLAVTMMGQQRFYQRNSELSAARRQLRTALSVVPFDLRAASSPGNDFTSFDATSITVRRTYGSAIMCARPNATTIVVPPTNTADHTLTSWERAPIAGDTLFIFDEGPLRGAEDDGWFAARITAVANDVNGCPLSPFLHATRDAGKARIRITIAQSMPDSVKVGAGIRFTEPVRYSLTKSTSSDRYYLAIERRTNGAWSTPTPIAGPYAAPTRQGLQFQYFDSLGVALGAGAASGRVARIDLRVLAEGMPGSRQVDGASDIPSDSLAFRIAVRNRQ